MAEMIDAVVAVDGLLSCLVDVYIVSDLCLLQKSLPLLRHSLSLNKMHIDGVRPPPPTPVLPSSAAGVAVLPQLVTASSAVHPGAPQPVVQPAAARMRVGGVVTAPRTAGVTQQTLPLAAVCCLEFCYSVQSLSLLFIFACIH